MALENICVSKGKTDYFKRLLPAELHDKIVEREKLYTRRSNVDGNDMRLVGDEMWGGEI